MEFSVEVEKPSSILRKFKIKVPAKEVKVQFDRGLISVQKTAKISGFRPGHAPIAMIKKFYGEDVRGRILNKLIGESFESAVVQNKLRTVGNPHFAALNSDGHDHSQCEHDHDHDHHDHSVWDSFSEEKDFAFVATVEIIPELTLSDYKGITLSKEKVDATDEEVEKIVKNLHESHAQLVPVSSGESESPRSVQKDDIVDLTLTGGIVTESGVQAHDDLKGTRLFEIKEDSWIPGFEAQIMGMKTGEVKIFRLPFPEKFSHPEMAGKEGEFTATVNEIKVKKLPEFDNEFAKSVGFETIEELKAQAKNFLVTQRTEEADRKLKSEILAKIIEKNPFEVPQALVETQTRSLAQDWATEMKRQRYDEKSIQETISKEIDQLKKRAENQVKASLVLETVAQAEGISVQHEELESEMDRIAREAQIERPKLDAFYAKNPGRKADLEFKMRQDRTLAFLLQKAEIKVA